MKLSRPVRRTPPETIIALIDVVFFLLVFFMLIGRMDATAPFEVRPATAITGSDMPAGGATLSIGITGTLALDGTEKDAPALLDALSAQLEADPELLVRINAHRDAVMADLLPLVAEIEALGARDIVLVVTPESP
ncbi:ExbD/TolR family protein [Pseudosulfitobacter koreensis]|uniref:Biopolymer transporter ExbD n=1 Tax=Pseudosulfitobacter koreensis TaxID=2968472 RepID=A0ABT1Z2I0_9RHOB|nr:biopolymer transporter ExbD [Pseudosulfitobacter koreense]MCR8827343.1 biopolymer transporter ExbD [Pseudosulfitobacter koreense]